MLTPFFNMDAFFFLRCNYFMLANDFLLYILPGVKQKLNVKGWKMFSEIISNDGVIKACYKARYLVPIPVKRA